MSVPASYPLTPKKRNRGFALLITISLIAFLVLIVVALSSTTRVETRVADNSQQLNQARQHALNALNLAVGQLQNHAGPDRRVTARAEITSTASLTQPLLTGVWETTNTTGTPDAWLVSGNETNSVAVTPTNALSPAAGNYPVDDTANEVFLLGDNSVDSPAQRIRVAKQNVTAPAGSIPGLTTSAVIGHHAYWVGDEGIKASASLIDPLLATDPIGYDNSGANPGDDWTGTPNAQRARLNQLQLPRPRLEAIFGSFDPDSAAAVNELPKLQGIRQLTVVTNAPSTADVRANFHAVTALSEAVLSDTLNGRLRRDLSDPAGADNLSAAVRAYRDFRVTTPASGFVADYTPAGLTPASATTFPAFSAAPVLSEFGLRFWFTLGGGTGTEIILNYIIEAELWNPYAARFTMVAGEPLSLDVGDLNVTVNTTGGGTHNINVGALITAAGITVDPAEIWEAGEVRLVSGATSLTTGGGQGTLATGADDAGITAIPSVDLPALNPQPKVELFVNQPTRALIQTYEPDIDHAAAAGAANGTTYSYGYGFNLRDELAHWTRVDSGDGRDPRAPVLDGDFFDSTWDNTAATNAGVSPDGALAGLTNATLFDLPRQELVSVGSLRNLAGSTPADLGNTWADPAVNAWFDQYYLSTVPRNHAWDFAAGQPLPNRHVRYYAPDDGNTPALADLRDDEQAARHLLLRGAFNLNSTSVAAWKAVLGAKINDWESESAAGTQTLDNVVLRLTHGAQQLPEAPLPNAATPALPIADADAVTTGGRQLTTAEVDALATAIVAELKTRGRPFASIRDLLADGLLTRALATANINAAAKIGADFAHSPAAVTQADLAALLAPFATVRSDTFLVRAYGDARNPVTGEIQGRAWCEATVQRVPETLDPTDDPLAPTGDFGRKFKITSFRWLASDDI
ncbi:MAG: hypothetical protein ABII82_17690 [Verrucomicrobiota bacterium]